MNTKHTPGPWKAVVDGHIAFVRTADDTADLAHTGLASRQVDTANARLIAAAPELLEALNGLLAHSESVNRAFFVDGTAKAMRAAMTGQKDLLNQARAAIAKARGNE